ncbi:MAG TPA: AAA family ATPase, partial [Caballeronia sp.]|nr:AAA family ATPase [Caballeronia sp.]
HEYGLAPLLDSSWAAQPLALYRRREPPMLVLDDDGGEPLHRSLGRPLELTRCLRIAANLARVVGHVHRCGLVHKDIKPANVLVDGNGNVRLTGFGIASQLPHEHQPPSPPEIVAGTFAYMAPEQTGRMNRSIDTRSDLYSLGVTLYEMLTGSLPFTASDAMEWIHCHIARRPTPPGERVDGIPATVEGIVLKLLAKAAEDRYQTAAGVEADLRSCLVAWEARHRIEPFPLGAHDASDRLLIPEKLYGRGAQIEALVTAFDRVVANGAVELVLISGYPGIGKSSVVSELHRVLVPPRGLFASGKFDQYKRDIPYVPFAQAFQTLVRNLLSKSDAEVETWRHALMEALGPNGQLIVNLIPELALIIGEQPGAPTLPPQDAQNRFQIVFRRFLGVFAQPEHPLALFIDDLQWVDTATLDLLAHLVTHPDVKHVLLVGAYRDNEVDASHPFARTLESINHAEGRLRQIELAPLTPDSVTQLVADSLHCDSATAGPLAQLVHEKTGGNPFFTIQFLTTLTDEDLLTFDQRAAMWCWYLPRIRAKGFTENVADLMAAKLSRLPPLTQDALGQLACLGNVAEVTALTWVQGGSEETMHANLWEAVRTGLVFRDANAYEFAHDRVQEAAYALIPADERAAAHLRIGRALVSRTAPEALEDAIFDIVNHLNRGATLIVTESEREQAVALNLIAGIRAMSSTAYAAALSYLAQGVGL